jgi:hypothetical protein
MFFGVSLAFHPISVDFFKKLIQNFAPASASVPVLLEQRTKGFMLNRMGVGRCGKNLVSERMKPV